VEWKSCKVQHSNREFIDKTESDVIKMKNLENEIIFHVSVGEEFIYIY